MSQQIRYYDRATGRLETETVLGDRWLRLAYESPIRGALQWPLFSCALASRILGWYLDQRCSASRIEPTVKELGIDLGEAEVPQGGFRCFNDFFSRELKPGARPLPEDPMRVPSPADCRLTVFPELPAGMVVPVKGTPYSVEELLGPQGSQYARCFDGGALALCRLCPADYHRYHFPDDGIQEDYWTTFGKYHSVNPVALERGIKVFTENYRTCRILDLKHGGRTAMFAVGAFGVASINDYADEKDMEFFRGVQAGFFAFGGSTVILVFPPGRVRFDQDILEQSAQGVETLVKANSAIGTWLR